MQPITKRQFVQYSGLAVAVGSLGIWDTALAAGPMKITVYGGRGRIGSQIVSEALSRGHTVISLDIKPVDPATPKRDRLTQGQGDLTDQPAVTKQITGQDIVIDAISAPTGEIIVNAAHSVVGAIRSLGGLKGPRLLWLGGAGSLHEADGGPLKFTPPPGPPRGAAPGGPPGGAPRGPGGQGGNFAPPTGSSAPEGLRQVLEYLKTVNDVRWSYYSPSIEIEDGPKTGKFRLGDDTVLRDSKDPQNRSHISTGDIAVALVDEAENAAHTGKRFTAGY